MRRAEITEVKGRVKQEYVEPILPWEADDIAFKKAPYGDWSSAPDTMCSKRLENGILERTRGIGPLAVGLAGHLRDQIAVIFGDRLGRERRASLLDELGVEASAAKELREFFAGHGTESSVGGTDVTEPEEAICEEPVEPPLEVCK
jgi:hypothetical protein